MPNSPTATQSDLRALEKMLALNLERTAEDIATATSSLLEARRLAREYEDTESDLGLSGQDALACEAWDVIECERVPALLRQVKAIIGSEAFSKLVETIL